MLPKTIPIVNIAAVMILLLAALFTVPQASVTAQMPPASVPSYFGAPANPMIVSGGGWLRRVVIVDMDGNGLKDIVTLAGISFATGPGVFMPQAPFAAIPFAGYTRIAFIVTDFNSDGIQDLIFRANLTPGTVPPPNAAPQEIMLALGTGAGNFAPLVIIPFGVPATYQPVTHVVVGDSNGDGAVDVVRVSLALCSNGLVFDTASWLGNAPTFVNSQFVAPVSQSCNQAQFVHLTDLNGDGADELVGTHTNSALTSLVVMPGIPGSYNFGFVHMRAAAPPGITYFYAAQDHLSLVDINGDGVRDPVIAGTASNVSRAVNWFPASASALLGPAQFLVSIHQFPDPFGGDFVADQRIYDYNGDGLLDVLSLHQVQTLPSQLSVDPRPTWAELRLGLDAGHFANPYVTHLAPQPAIGVFLAIGQFDLDQDGDAEPMTTAFDPSGAHITLRIIPNNAITGLGCGGMGGLVIPGIPGAPPTIGDQGFAFRVSNVAPGANVLLLASLGISTGGPCGQPTVSLAPGQFLSLPNSFSQVTCNPLGQGAIRLPIPPDISLIGLQWYAQWLVPNPTVTLGYALSPVRNYILR